MAEPADRQAVVDALRMGWAVAEVRGRVRRLVEGPRPPEVTDLATRVMPLRAERSPTERRIEAQRILSALAHQLGVECFSLDGAAPRNVPEYVGATAKAIYDALYGSPVDQGTADAQWPVLAKALYLYDAAVEDALAARSETVSAGYQLGRGLADSYWFESGRFARPPAEGAADAWKSLLGDERCDELERLVGRLSAYFGHFTAPAVAGSLEVWRAVAADDRWREEPTTGQKLSKQTRRWYELLVIGQDPTTLVHPYRRFANVTATVKAVQAFVPQLLLVVVSIGLVVGLTFLASSGRTSAWLNSLLGLLSATGLTVAAAQARLKNSAQALLSRITEDAYTEVIAAELVEMPDKPGTRKSPSAVAVGLVRKRRLTTAGATDP